MRMIRIVRMRACLGLVGLMACGSLALAAVGFRPIDLSEPSLTYRSKDSAVGAFSTYTESVTGMTVGGQDVFQIRSGAVLTLIEAESYRPIRVEHLDDTGERVGLVEYRSGSAVFDFPGQKLKKTLKLGGIYYDCNTIYQLFRAFPYGEGREIVFTIVMDGRYGSPVGPRRMYIKDIGREKIEVPAGSFVSHKLEMGVAGVAGIFAGKYKYHFWYTADERHYLLKYYDKATGATTELVRGLGG